MALSMGTFFLLGSALGRDRRPRVGHGLGLRLGGDILPALLADPAIVDVLMHTAILGWCGEMAAEISHLVFIECFSGCPWG